MSLHTKQDHRLPAQLAARLAQRIETHALRPGTRLPSIRNCAVESRVSRSTVVEAYDQLIAQGLRNKEIAVTLGISEQTAKVHVKNILAKLNVSDRSAVIAVAVRRGIIHIT